MGVIGLLVLYFTIVSLISGRDFAFSQFAAFWYFIIGLAGGFGIQIGLYSYLKSAINLNASKGVIAVSGTTSTVAMISCCAHYFANLLPIIGVSGAIALIGQYQIELFWLGLAANAASVAYISSRIRRFAKQHSS